MKRLLVFALIVITTRAFAQVPNQKNSRMAPVPDTVRNYKGDNADVLRKQFRDYFESKKLEKQLLADKQGNIVRLPQDHMPCVVPDSTSAGLMPNAWEVVTLPFRPQYHPIPNPALPKQSSQGETQGQTK